MPPASAGIRDLSAAPDGGSFPPLLLGTDRFDHPYNPRRPSRDALQTHFALESAYQLHDPPSALRRAFSPQLAASSQRPQTDTASLQSSSNTQAPRKKILRPPNAWILYRSDKLADAKDSQGQRTPQAELSKHIAESWRAEPPEVKRQYERQAELRKLQHEAQYPGRPGLVSP